jgi:coatomer subunit beta'
MNISFNCYIQVNDLEKCLEILIDSGQLPEACLFCRTYLPSKLPSTLEHWNSKLNDCNSNSRLSKTIQYFIFIF